MCECVCAWPFCESESGWPIGCMVTDEGERRESLRTPKVLGALQRWWANQSQSVEGLDGPGEGTAFSWVPMPWLRAE